MSDRRKEASLGALSFILRHQELWPKGFEWNFQFCNSCAMGLASELWPEEVLVPSKQSMIDAFGMRLWQAEYCFAGPIYLETKSKVTPEQVADRIDQVAEAFD